MECWISRRQELWKESVRMCGIVLCLPITMRIAARLPAFLLARDLLLTEERLFCLILL